MPVRSDDSGRRWVEMELLVPGTPEQVWEAIATGPGNSAWFTPTTIEEKQGGDIEFDFGGGLTQHGTVTGWEPPYRFAYEERDWSSTVSPGPLATEITVTARSGDRCVIRMVHSLFTEKDDWDDELETFEQGWPGFFEVLRRYLQHFAGAPGAAVHAMVPFTGDIRPAYRRLTDALGLSATDVGDRCQTTGAAPTLAGVVDLVHQDTALRDVIVRLEQPAAGLAVFGGFTAGDHGRMMITIYFYGAGAADAAAAEQPKWSAWLADLFADQAVAT